MYIPIMIRCIAALTLGLLSLPAAEGLAPTVEKGLPATLSLGGVDLLASGGFHLLGATLEQSGSDEKGRTYTFADLAPASPGPGMTSLKADWGEVSVAWKAQGQRLDATLSITNASDRTLADWSVELLRLRFPDQLAETAKGQALSRNGLDSLPVLTCTSSAGRLVVTTTTPQHPITLVLAKAEADGSRALIITGGTKAREPSSYGYWPLGLPRVAPQETLAITISLRGGPTEGGTQPLVQDAIEAFREVHPPRLNWPDRRPIGMLFIPSEPRKYPANPRGWFKDQAKDIDIATDAGRAKLTELLDTYTERCIGSLRKVNAQGAIMWHIEGEENKHPITYIGDPRLTEKLAPEMDAIADRFFSKMKEAGLRTGICIRPSQVYYNEEKKAWAHSPGNDNPGQAGGVYSALNTEGLASWQFFPVAERLGDKIEYAKKRWGCTIFYIDTNGVFHPFGREQKFEWSLIQSDIIAAVMRRHPDVLIIPELQRGAGAEHSAYWSVCAPYGELDMGCKGTPWWPKTLYPEAFTVNNVSDGKFAEQREAMVESVRKGDVLMVHGWWSPKRNEEVLSVYQEVYPGFLEKQDRGAWRGE